MKKDIYELNGLNDRDIRRIEKALGLYEGTINTDTAPPRASENCDFIIKISFIDRGKNFQ